VELAWGIVDPIQRAWEQKCLPEMAEYETGEWGPKESAKWMWRDGRDWLDACPVLKGAAMHEE
jgi:glucose-6-phosphate 1-dehydrogenase